MFCCYYCFWLKKTQKNKQAKKLLTKEKKFDPVSICSEKQLEERKWICRLCVYKLPGISLSITLCEFLSYECTFQWSLCSHHFPHLLMGMKFYFQLVQCFIKRVFITWPFVEYICGKYIFPDYMRFDYAKMWLVGGEITVQAFLL